MNLDNIRTKSFCFSNLHTSLHNGEIPEHAPNLSIKKTSKQSRIRRLRRTIINSFTFPSLIILVINGNTSVTSFSFRSGRIYENLSPHSTSPKSSICEFVLYSTIDSNADSKSLSVSNPVDTSKAEHEESKPVPRNSGYIGVSDLMNKNAESLMIYNTDMHKVNRSNGSDLSKRNGKSEKKELRKSTLMRVRSKRPWKRRHARSIEEGIRNERIPQRKNSLEEYSSQVPFLSKLLETTQKTQKKKIWCSHYFWINFCPC